MFSKKISFLIAFLLIGNNVNCGGVPLNGAAGLICLGARVPLFTTAVCLAAVGVSQLSRNATLHGMPYFGAAGACLFLNYKVLRPLQKKCFENSGVPLQYNPTFKVLKVGVGVSSFFCFGLPIILGTAYVFGQYEFIKRVESVM
jgi:hypothetical protein